MKLYTEEQVIQAFKDGFVTAINEGTYDYVNEYMDELTPIELPSDEEIDEIFPKKFQSSYLQNWGAKWMRDKILKQNK